MTNLVLNVTTTAALDSGLQYQWSSRLTVAPPNPGSGYAVGDVLTLAGGTGTAAQFRVEGIGVGGAVTSASLVNSGEYTVLPTAPLNTTGGTGTGCRLKTSYPTISNMLEDFILSAIRDYRRQYKDAQRSVMASAIENATNAQLTSAAAALGVTLP